MRTKIVFSKNAFFLFWSVVELKLVRNYKRKSTRGSYSQQNKELAIAEILVLGQPMRKAANAYKTPESTIRTFMQLFFRKTIKKYLNNNKIRL